jgi:hypothetical protein
MNPPVLLLISEPLGIKSIAVCSTELLASSAIRLAIDKYPHLKQCRPGDVIFEDYYSDGKIDANDMFRIFRNDIPRFTGGITANLQYRGFDLSLLIQGASGAVRYISTRIRRNR